jgi:hypothetical protein
MNDEPTIIIGGDVQGVHHQKPTRTRKRIKDGKGYRDLSTVMVCPTRGVIPARVVQSMMDMVPLMNQPFVRMFIERMEVAAAYNAAVETILNHPALQNFRYMLTYEEDNMPPPDGLHRLFESIDEYAIVAGLYFTKGEGGQPMIYGDPKGVLTFQPQVPRPNAIQECNGTGMGFTLFDMNLFRDESIPRPWFQTLNEWTPEGGARVGTQDLFFMGNARRAGYRIASDNRVKVGHYDAANRIVW